MFGSSTGTFDRLVDKATSQLLLEPDWDSILAICDCIRGGDVKPKYAVGTIKKKIGNDNPHVSLFALQTLESCVKNCGSLVHEEIATKEFMEFFKDLVKKRPDPVKAKLLELVQIWSQAFRNEPSYKVVQDTFQIMKMEGYTFPALKEADAMFMAEKAPEWKDGEVCHRCRVQFSTFQRKHHCRNCGQVFCNRCSSKNSIIPKFGIEKEVRVCEACFDVLNKGAIKKEDEGDLPAEYLNSPLAKQAQTPAAGGKSEQEIAEEEELQLALALSKSEADEKEKTRQRMSLNYTPYGSTAEPPPAPVYAEPAKMATPAVIDTSDMDPELARYLNRNYWQQKQEDIKPTTSTTTTTTTPSAPIATTTEPRTSNAQEGAVEEKYQNGTSTEAENQDEEQFLNALKSSIEIFVNRMKSNSMRGRSIANDTSVQTLFMTINAMHPELMKHVQTQEESRSHYESLQDKLVQLKDAREALDALREEHREKRRREQEELERQRQIQMAHKLEILRQKKQEYLEYQRQLALQRMQEQEREMQMRLEQQKQMQQMRAMQYGSMQYPQQMYGQQMAPTFSPGGSAEGSPLHQAHAPPPSGPYAPPPQGIGMAPGAPGGQMPPVSQGYGQQFPPQAPGGYQPPGGYQAPPASYPQQGAPPPTTAGYMPPTTAQQQPPGPAGPVSMNMEFPSFSMQGMAASLPQGAPPPQPQAPPPQGQQQYVGGPQGQYAPPPAGQALPPVGQAPPPGAAMPGQDEGQQQLICFD